MPTDFGPIKGFLSAAKGRSQEEIIKEFLIATVIADPVADHGTVLVNDPRGRRLIVFNQDDFLFENRLLDPARRADWPMEFPHDQSIAGYCFRQKRTVVFCRAQASPVTARFFTGDSPIENMICIPITMAGGDPFGVVCFHNNAADKVFGPAEATVLEAFVDVLAVALHSPLPELYLEKNVFIVHGRRQDSLDQLQLLLLKHNVSPKVLGQASKGPNAILDELEGLVRICKAGFILVTPDDEGRLRGTEEPLVARARENVIFEAGLLFAKYREFNRVELLLEEPAVLPSDLSGIYYERFAKIADIEARIEDKLGEWGLLPGRSPQRRAG